MGNIRYLILENDGENRIISEFQTNNVWLAISDVLLKSKFKVRNGLSTKIEFIHKKGAYTMGALFFDVSFFSEDKLVGKVVFKSKKALEDKDYWSLDTVDLYAGTQYKKSLIVYEERLREFMNERSLLLIPLISFAIKNKDHPIWDNYSGSDKSLGGNGSIDISKPLVR